jgi:hypothetical protein
VKYRLYIDESGDHTYKHLDEADTRYLGLTGVLIEKDFYSVYAQPELENLKRRCFRYDPDIPPILVRSLIKHRKQWFYVLQDKALNEKWEAELLSYINGITRHTNVFTVVIDKKEHLVKYPNQTFDPYSYSLHVLLNRVRGLLVVRREKADIMVESRGGVEDKQINNAYIELRTQGSYYGDGNYYCEAYPEDELLIKRKDNNITGLQIADLLAYGQKAKTVLESKKPFTHALGNFEADLNKVADIMVNRFGRYLLV